MTDDAAPDATPGAPPDATPELTGAPDSHDSARLAPGGLVCPWCSAALPSADAAACPSCGATLVETPTEDEVPGVTSIHPEYAARAARAARGKEAGQRRGLLGWLAGDVEEGPDDAAEEAAPEGAFDRPSEDVRREMLRLEMEALLREAEAEAAELRMDQDETRATTANAGAADDTGDSGADATMIGDTDDAGAGGEAAAGHDAAEDGRPA